MSRRIVFALVALIVVLGLVVPATSVSAQAKPCKAAPISTDPTVIIGCVSRGQYLIVRDTPRVLKSKELGVIQKNETFTVIGVDRRVYWVKIKTNSGVVGWVSYFSVLLSAKRNKLPIVS